MDSKIKNDTYYSVQSFMVKDMGLKDVELAIYAIIYGFSQDGESAFNGSLSYLAEWTSKSRECICRTLKSLVENTKFGSSGYIIVVDQENNIKFVKYSVNNFKLAGDLIFDKIIF